MAEWPVSLDPCQEHYEKQVLTRVPLLIRSALGGASHDNLYNGPLPRSSRGQSVVNLVNLYL